MTAPHVAILAMLSLLITWAIVAASMVGLGLLVQNVVLRRDSSTIGTARPDGAQLTVLFWVGYAAAVCVLQVWHFIWPINGVASLLLLLCGLIALAVAAKRRGHVLHLIQGVRDHPLATVCFAALVTWASMHALGPGNAHDSGLYHYAIVQWLQREPIIPGIGNLSFLFAQNSAHLIFGAALDQGPWNGRGEHLLNGLLVFVMCGLAVRGLACAVRPCGHRGPLHQWLHWYDAMLIVPIIAVILTKGISSPSTDVAPSFLVLMMVRQLAMLVFGSQLTVDGKPSTVNRQWTYVSLAALGATAVVVKLSTAPLVAAIVPVAFVLWLRDRLTPAARVRTALISAAIGVMLIAPWMARNVVMTGYPLFPSGVVKVSTQWQVPEETVAFFANDIAVHGKVVLPDLTYRTLDRVFSVPQWLRVKVPDAAGVTALNWIPAWLVTMPAHSPVACLVPLLLIAGCLLLTKLRAPRVEPPRGMLVAAIPLMAALAFWFFTVPTPRFAIGMTWSLAALFIVAAVPARFEPGSHARRIALGAVVLPGILAILVWGVIEQKVRGEGSHPLIDLLVQRPGPDRGFHPRPVVETTVWLSNHGVEVSRPVTGTLVWNAPQPAVGWPEPSANLAYRQPGNLRAGFHLKGREE